jgi:hypothetical protein
MQLCKSCHGSGGHTLECGCGYDCERCKGTGQDPSERELAERERLAIEDAAMAAAGVMA